MYVGCPECRRRMTRVIEDKDGDRAFYLCRSGCGSRFTFHPERNFLGRDWPDEVFEQAVRDGWIEKDGTVREG